MSANLATIDPTITITHPSDHEAVVRREFRAPADDLFTVWTTPALVRRWWSSFGEMSVCEIDARVGGTWRWGHFNREHNVEVAYFGTYLAVDRPDRLTFTEEFVLMPGSEYTNEITFDEANGVTTLTEHMTYSSQEWRDNHFASHFEEGLSGAFQRIDALLADKASWPSL
jgi:uncharacterized protein YndB with AHSA1/START domain